MQAQKRTCKHKKEASGAAKEGRLSYHPGVRTVATPLRKVPNSAKGLKSGGYLVIAWQFVPYLQGLEVRGSDSGIASVVGKVPALRSRIGNTLRAAVGGSAESVGGYLGAYSRGVY
eukprot:3366819-Rhodomonas_salina.3